MSVEFPNYLPKPKLLAYSEKIQKGVMTTPMDSGFVRVRKIRNNFTTTYKFEFVFNEEEKDKFLAWYHYIGLNGEEEIEIIGIKGYFNSGFNLKFLSHNTYSVTASFISNERNYKYTKDEL